MSRDTEDEDPVKAAIAAHAVTEASQHARAVEKAAPIAQGESTRADHPSEGW